MTARTPDFIKDLKTEMNEKDAEGDEAPKRCKFPGGCPEPAARWGLAACAVSEYEAKDGRMRDTDRRLKDLIPAGTLCEEHLKLQSRTVNVLKLQTLRTKEREVRKRPALDDGFRVGDEVEDREGDRSVIEGIDEATGLLTTDRGWTYKPSDLTRVGG